VSEEIAVRCVKDAEKALNIITKIIETL